jgi:hypothetical protein
VWGTGKGTRGWGAGEIFEGPQPMMPTKEGPKPHTYFIEVDKRDRRKEIDPMEVYMDQIEKINNDPKYQSLGIHIDIPEDADERWTLDNYKNCIDYAIERRKEADAFDEMKQVLTEMKVDFPENASMKELRKIHYSAMVEQKQYKPKGRPKGS